MKKKLLIIKIFGVLFVIMIGIFRINNEVTVLSDYILNNINTKYNYSFSNNNLTSSILLEYLDYNAKELKSNIKINKLIKNSKKIYISVGMNDLLNFVSLDENKLIYNPTLINQKIALLEYNLHEIISSILAIKEVDIYYISLYYLNDERFDSIIEECNFELKDLLESMNVTFIDISNEVKIKNFKFNNENKECINNLIESMS